MKISAACNAWEKHLYVIDLEAMKSTKRGCGLLAKAWPARALPGEQPQGEQINLIRFRRLGGHFGFGCL
jgi:hypothetical protein